MNSANMSVPMGNLFAQYLSIKNDIDTAMQRVIETSSFIRGKDVEVFEKEFSMALGAKHCISCGNGTDAIYISLIALGVKPGDEIIVPAMSWISTSETVSQAGARVVFCDIDPVTNTLDVNQLASCLSDATVGIIPVHLYGHPANMDPILEFANDHGLWVIEDSAQAHFAKYNGQYVGSFGSASTFSFYPGKNLGAFGDAGGILTNDSSLAKYMAMFARHGGLKKGEHEIKGINSRLDGLQAAILSVKLRYLKDWTERRREIAEYYHRNLSDIEGLTLPIEASWAEHVWHLFVVRTAKRDKLLHGLKKLGVETSINYPCALPLLPCYKKHGYSPMNFPNAYQLSKTGLSIPLYPELTNEQLAYVVKAIKTVMEDLS